MNATVLISDKKSILKNGDVLTNIVGASIGRTAIFNMDDVANAFSSKAIRIREPESNAAPSNPQAGVKTVQLQIMP